MIEKIFKRKLIKEIEKYLDSKEAIVVYGARQVGKTSLMKYLINNFIKNNVFYFDLELSNLLSLCEEGPESVYKYLLEKGANEKQKIFLIIDEVQYLKDPTKFIKIFHDHYSNVKLIVSGSSTFEIKKKFKESLAGRIVSFELYPLDFEEFLIFKEKNYKLSKENSQSLNQELKLLAKEFIRFGGYPKIVLENSEEKKQVYLMQIISTYIRKDIRDIGNIRDITSFNNLLEILASQSGKLLNILELSNTLKLNRETIREYLNLLENTFIIKIMKPFHKNIKSELSKNPKVFFLDTGMMHLLWLKEFPKVILGNSFETFIFTELIKSKKTINFWRTTNSQEIDFVVKNRSLYAIETKYNFQNQNRKNLEFFSKNYKCKTFIVGFEGDKKGKYPWELMKEIEEDNV